MKLTIFVMALGFVSIASAKDVYSVEGELFKKMNVEVMGESKNFDKEMVAAKLAQQQCEKMGFKYRLAFYYENKDKKTFLTDVFCSNTQTKPDSNVSLRNLARAAMLKNRGERGASLHPNAKSTAQSYANTEIKGFTVIDFSLPVGSPGGPKQAPGEPAASK